jgi:hypothetical protein
MQLPNPNTANVVSLLNTGIIKCTKLQSGTVDYFALIELLVQQINRGTVSVAL